MWVFPCAEAAQAHSTLQPPQDPFYAAKSCIGLIYLIFKREAVHGSKQSLLSQGRGDACSCPGYLPVRFHLFQPWGGQDKAEQLLRAGMHRSGDPRGHPTPSSWAATTS